MLSVPLCFKKPSSALEIGNTETRRTQRKRGGRSEPISHAKEQRRKEDQNSFVLCLERWVSRSVVNRADVRGGIWDVEVVEEIIGRPLHHTLLIVESQQAVSSVVLCSALLRPPAPYSRPSGTRRAGAGWVALDLHTPCTCLRHLLSAQISPIAASFVTKTLAR